MKPTTILFVFAAITCFSFSKPKENLKPAVTTLEGEKINNIDSLPVFKMTSTGIITSRKLMIPKPVITGGLSMTKFDAATNYIKGRGTMEVWFPKLVDPSKPIEFAGNDIKVSPFGFEMSPEITWYLSFPEKKRFSLTFKLQVPSTGKFIRLEIYLPNSAQPTIADFNSTATEITYTAVLDLTDFPGNCIINLHAVNKYTQWLFSNLLIQEIN